MVNDPAVFNTAVAPKAHAMDAVRLSLSIARSFRDAAARTCADVLVIVAAETDPVMAETVGRITTVPILLVPAGVAEVFWTANVPVPTTVALRLAAVACVTAVVDPVRV